jgi:hypothetical protein
MEYRPLPQFPGYDISAEGEVRSYWRFKAKGRGVAPEWNLSTTPRTLTPDNSSKIGGPRFRLRTNAGEYKQVYVSMLLREIFPEKQNVGGSKPISETK